MESIARALVDAATWVLNHSTSHRLAVLATRVMGIEVRTGALPADGAGLDLAGGRDRRTLVYRRLGDRRFTMAVDPAGPRPEYDSDQRKPTLPGAGSELFYTEVVIDRANTGK